MLLRRQATLRRRPSQERSTFTFDAILDAAEEALVTDGADALQMSLLIKRAGVSAGTLYQYFPDKTAILRALDDRMCARWVSDLKYAIQTARGATLNVFLEVVSASVTDRVCRDHRLRLALREGLSAAHPGGELTDYAEPIVEFMVSILSNKLGATSERVKSLCRLMVWTADGLLEGALGRVEIAQDELRHALFAAWSGILAGL